MRQQSQQNELLNKDVILVSSQLITKFIFRMIYVLCVFGFFLFRLVLPGDVARHGVSEGTKAMTKYIASRQ